MKTLKYILITALGLFIVRTLSAQTDTIVIEGKNQKRIIILEKGEETSIILKDDNSNIYIDMENKENKENDSSLISWDWKNGRVNVKAGKAEKNYSVNVLSDFSFGFATAANLTVPNNPPFPLPIGPQLNNGFNFSMNFIKQEINLVNHKLYLTAALGLNNFYYGVNNQSLVPVSGIGQGATAVFVADSVNAYKRNRIDSRFTALPIMLKWQSKASNNKKLSLAAGVELNFNNRVYSKLRIDTDNKELNAKQKVGFAHNTIVPSFITRAQIGSLGFFVRYIPKGVINAINHASEIFSFGLATKF